jgi:hypothetical protein
MPGLSSLSRILILNKLSWPHIIISSSSSSIFIILNTCYDINYTSPRSEVLLQVNIQRESKCIFWRQIIHLLKCNELKYLGATLANWKVFLLKLGESEFWKYLLFFNLKLFILSSTVQIWGQNMQQYNPWHLLRVDVKVLSYSDGRK